MQLHRKHGIATDLVTKGDSPNVGAGSLHVFPEVGRQLLLAIPNSGWRGVPMSGRRQRFTRTDTHTWPLRLCYQKISTDREDTRGEALPNME